jgi:hypothetical protein
MTGLRIANILIWGVLLIYAVPGAWGAVSGNGTRRGDPMRLACVATAFVMIGFSARWLLAPENVMLWQALYVLSGATGMYIIRVAWAYGRGPRV